MLVNLPFAMVGGVFALLACGPVPVGAGLGGLHRALRRGGAERAGARVLHLAAPGRGRDRVAGRAARVRNEAQGRPDDRQHRHLQPDPDGLRHRAGLRGAAPARRRGHRRPGQLDRAHAVRAAHPLQLGGRVARAEGPQSGRPGHPSVGQTRLITATAARQSASVMPSCVTRRRRPPPKFETSTPFRPSASSQRLARPRRSAARKTTMFVSTSGGSSATPGERGDAVRQDAGVAVIVGQPAPPCSVSATMPGAAITPAWRMPPPRIFRIRRASSTKRGGPADERADRRRQAFRQAELDRRHVPRPVGDRAPGRHGGVEEPRAVEVDGQAVLGGDARRTSREVLGREDPRRRSGCACSRGRSRPAARSGSSGSCAPAGEWRPRSASSGSVPSALVRTGRKHQAAERRRPAVLVVIDVRLVAQDDVLAAPAVREQRREVAHRAARDEHGGFLAGHLRGKRLQAIDRRIVAEHVVADLGGRHGLAHGRRGDGDRVASQSRYAR
ncbi:MAG: hypothetical protein MZV63_23950 [Marinilabiliales bacterium]|nr:hypothetical protein [Marinilabiliales bacterium]